MNDPYTICACTCGTCDDDAHCPDHCKPAPLNAADKKLLSKLSEKDFEFSHNAAEEKRLYGLYRRGMVERRHEIFSRTSNGVKYRWSYRVKS